MIRERMLELGVKRGVKKRRGRHYRASRGDVVVVMSMVKQAKVQKLAFAGVDGGKERPLNIVSDRAVPSIAARRARLVGGSGTVGRQPLRLFS